MEICWRWGGGGLVGCGVRGGRGRGGVGRCGVDGGGIGRTWCRRKASSAGLMKFGM